MTDLYQQVIIDHAQKPRNRGVCEHATHFQQGKNPLCGDQLQVTLLLDGDTVKDLRFEGEGCAISLASASLMTEAAKGKSIAEIESMFSKVHNLFTKGGDESDQELSESLGKLLVLKGVHAYPMRVKCATLAWHTLLAALQGDQMTVSTEDEAS